MQVMLFSSTTLYEKSTQKGKHEKLNKGTVEENFISFIIVSSVCGKK